MRGAKTVKILTLGWTWQIPLVQQSVLILACRGPDGMDKFHPSKDLLRIHRATVLNAGKLGREIRPGEGDNFMRLTDFNVQGTTDDEVVNRGLMQNYFRKASKAFFGCIDSLPHHYVMHAIHAAEIIGYKHPDVDRREMWEAFYRAACDDMHMNPETEEEMDARLSGD